jgi:hypothetical protein
MIQLRVLARTGMTACEKSGRTVTCRLAAAPIESGVLWLSRYERFWAQQLNRLAIRGGGTMSSSRGVRRKAPLAQVLSPWTGRQNIGEADRIDRGA